MKISKRDRDVWRIAMTLARNLCVQRSDNLNADDGPFDRIDEARECAERIESWLAPSDEQLKEMFKEGGAYVEPDWLSEALNSGDGVYRP